MEMEKKRTSGLLNGVGEEEDKLLNGIGEEEGQVGLWNEIGERGDKWVGEWNYSGGGQVGC